MQDAHSNFTNAWNYVSSYLKQVNHMMQDAGMEVETNGWHRIRTDGEKYESELAPKIGSTEHWLPKELIAFYAAGDKKPWGHPIADYSHIAFVGVCLSKAVPLLTLGYFQIIGQTGGVEARLRAHDEKSFYNLIEPQGLESPPDVCSSLEFEWPQPSGFKDSYGANGTRMSLVDIPLALIDGPEDLQKVLQRFVKALP